MALAGLGNMPHLESFSRDLDSQ